MPEYLTSSEFERFENRLFKELDDIKDGQKELKAENLKNAPIIAFAGKLQSNMTKIVTSLVILITGSWVVGSNNTPPDHVEPTTKKDKNDKN